MFWIIGTIITGLIAGYLAGRILKGRGFGLLGNLVVGVIGSFLGALLLPLVGIRIDGLVGNIIEATIGAVGLLAAIGLVKKG